MMRGVATFGDRLREAMRLRQMDREALATAMEVGPTQVDKWLSPKANPRLDTLLRLATKLDVSVEWLCAFDEGHDGAASAYRESRARHLAPERLAETFQQIDDPGARADLWRMIQRLAGTLEAGASPDEDAPGAPTGRGPQLASR